MNVVITILYVALRIIIAFLTLRLGMRYAEQGNVAYKAKVISSKNLEAIFIMASAVCRFAIEQMEKEQGISKEVAKAYLLETLDISSK